MGKAFRNWIWQNPADSDIIFILQSCAEKERFCVRFSGITASKLWLGCCFPPRMALLPFPPSHRRRRRRYCGINFLLSQLWIWIWMAKRERGKGGRRRTFHTSTLSEWSRSTKLETNLKVSGKGDEKAIWFTKLGQWHEPTSTSDWEADCPCALARV